MKRCRHDRIRTIYGDRINAVNGDRSECVACGATFPDFAEYRAYLAAWSAAREEAVETLRLLRPNSEGYRRTEWEGFNFDLPTADAIDEAFNVGIAAIRSRLDAASRDGGV